MEASLQRPAFLEKAAAKQSFTALGVQWSKTMQILLASTLSSLLQISKCITLC